MTQPVVVRKYENRRLYDTSSSRYVNLPEIAQMVREGVEVQVVDAKSGEDLTRVTSDRAFRDFVAWYADAALSAQRGAKEVFPPLAHALPFLERTLETLKQKAATAGPARPEPPEPAEVEALKTRIATLEAQLAGRRPPRRKASKVENAGRRVARRPAR
jgi:hypothetical protein